MNPELLPKSHLFSPPSEWGPEQLRDYAIYEMTKVTGELARHPEGIGHDTQIFTGFMIRHDRAVQIARYAFDILHGLWYARPVTVTSFTAGADPYFAEPIHRLILEAEK